MQDNVTLNVTLVAASFGGIESVRPLGSAAARSTTVRLPVMATKAEPEMVIVTAVIMVMVVMTIVTVMVVVMVVVLVMVVLVPMRGTPRP